MSDRRMKRLESKKSHSWWWDSHISPKNSKWLSENLEEMDRSVKRMLKLIEEEGDSFAKKAEMYYQRRPELISHVEEFYRMYRSLAERYDNLTGELRKNMASDLESQGSGVSDSNSEIATPLALDRKPSRRKSGARAAGFDVFLGSGGGSSDLSRKESDDSSSSSSSSDSELSSKHNGFGQSANGDVEGLRFRIIELEVEIRELKEKLRAAEEENSNVLSRLSGIGNMEELMSRVAWYEEELKVASERLKISEEEISRLNHKLDTNDSLEIVHNLHAQLESAEKEITLHLTELKVKDNQVFELNERITELEGIIKDEHDSIEALEQELNITKKEVKSSDEEIGRLKVELERKSSPEATNELCDHLVSTPTTSRNGDVILEANRDGMTDGNADMMSPDLKAMEEELRTRNDKLLLSGEEIAKLKLELEKTKISAATSVDLQLQLESAQEEIKKRESELEQEKKQVLELQDRIMRLESDIVDRDLEIGQLKSAIFDAHQDFSVEKSQLEKVVSGLSESIKSLEARLEEWELRGRSLEEEIKRVESEKSEIQQLHDSRERATQVEMERLKSGMEERSKCIEELNKSFDALKLKYDMLMSERDELSARVTRVTTELGTKDDHLHRLHLEHVELISGCERLANWQGDFGRR
ncbi:hypothetical protein Syun_000032 [Stephania yunnanensis]|uniref:NAB domain-containing protein n=1 Tax=Stephania yunnanensis TaxID=152371 RepID=A0AAP0LB47_9MAGN